MLGNSIRHKWFNHIFLLYFFEYDEYSDHEESERNATVEMDVKYSNTFCPSVIHLRVGYPLIPNSLQTELCLVQST